VNRQMGNSDKETVKKVDRRWGNGKSLSDNPLSPAPAKESIR
jgi:hypothetical protein